VAGRDRCSGVREVRVAFTSLAPMNWVSPVDASAAPGRLTIGALVLTRLGWRFADVS